MKKFQPTLLQNFAFLTEKDVMSLKAPYVKSRLTLKHLSEVGTEETYNQSNKRTDISYSFTLRLYTFSFILYLLLFFFYATYARLRQKHHSHMLITSLTLLSCDIVPN